jgi:hypothetical protein
MELWTRDDRNERMLFAGTSLDKARSILANVRHRPATRPTIRRRLRVLDQCRSKRLIDLKRRGPRAAALVNDYCERRRWNLFHLIGLLFERDYVLKLVNEKVSKEGVQTFRLSNAAS